MKAKTLMDIFTNESRAANKRAYDFLDRSDKEENESQKVVLISRAGQAAELSETFGNIAQAIQDHMDQKSAEEDEEEAELESTYFDLRYENFGASLD